MVFIWFLSGAKAMGHSVAAASLPLASSLFQWHPTLCASTVRVCHSLGDKKSFYALVLLCTCPNCLCRFTRSFCGKHLDQSHSYPKSRAGQHTVCNKPSEPYLYTQLQITPEVATCSLIAMKLLSKRQKMLRVMLVS